MSENDQKGVKFIRALLVTTGAVATLGFLVQLSEVASEFLAAARACFGLPLSVLLVYLEFRPVPLLQQYASFYYSYMGRALLQLLLAVMLLPAGFFQVCAFTMLFMTGFICAALELSSSAPELPSFRNDGRALSIGAEEDDDMI
ncbi:AGR106Cp [Eremothecium gossypii ATCC 10895]|uniref:Golgi apparatus membrane protein TVP15 n=1 Tax=Eremothecium gossypii (strain ATCC 10895 / CBS 109.51 / FGSC 9923 / NRRL Y-1056) TaxID=284811 RepID=TVP15_EREGS|nr:AGR106Cp [Eremothecium gossypii ATCC 10895]Q74ZU2.1 RecName: Full=Golgi apparatus membrane protein TVP15 [Eremothecium gossypii ATCC 10895]AAS54596.1 AGR106Cp [Eremothecium gossypii ATCC 10895]AEY98927.1 FAGR106Cp [Eremothecium gossypii FDAG1]